MTRKNVRTRRCLRSTRLVRELMRRCRFQAEPDSSATRYSAAMYKTCPKCGYQQQATDAASAESCPSCGLVYRKYLQSLAGTPVRTSVAADDDGEHRSSWFERLLYVPERVESWRVYANIALAALSLYLGVSYYRMDVADWEIGATFLNTAITPFHEFGHILFRPFGEFMTNLGGSLAQLMLPLGFLLLFALKNRDNFAASLMLWWMGTQFLCIAPYIYDAETPTHILLTGRTGDAGAHDFIDVLGDLGWLNRGHRIAAIVHGIGLAVMLAAWAWGVMVLVRQWRRRSDAAGGAAE